MIRIMIVDDMPIDREYLLNFIDWERYGFQPCCVAKDGREALELYEEYEPDIILTDIMMPHMNGIELSEAIKKNYPEASIVLITGNSEFEYARKAVKLGVCDYIVKPFEKEELIITLLKLQDNMNKMVEHSGHIKQSKIDKKEEKLRKLIYSRQDKNLPEIEKLFPYNYYMVYTIQIHMYENKIVPEEVYQWNYVLESFLKNKLDSSYVFQCFHDYEGNIVTILNFRDEREMKSYQGYEFDELLEIASNHIGMEIKIGISDYCYDLHSLRDCYYHSLQGINLGTDKERYGFYDYKKLIETMQGEFYSATLMQEIMNYLDVLDYESTEAVVYAELKRIEHYRNMELSNMIYTSLLSILFSYLAQKGSDIHEVFGKEFLPYTYLNEELQYDKKTAFILNCYKIAIDYRKKHQNSRSYHIAKEARNYINENYQNPELSINDIIKRLLVNQTYLRMMFKEEYGMTITDYITKVRMEKAKELIQNEHIKLSVVSEAVGYNDTSYFSKCFKKYFGYLPSDVIFTNKF